MEENLNEKEIRESKKEDLGLNEKEIRESKKENLDLNEKEYREITKKTRLFVIPVNDLEALKIAELLRRNGERYIITGQQWGASWENLEPAVLAKIEEAKKVGAEVYGVELQGDSKGAINIDHHIYGDDDRSNEKSSIEQVAEIIGVELTLEELFVAANDKGYIPAMEELGAKLGIKEDELKEIIANIRRQDREGQGVTIEKEAQAEEAIEKLGEIKVKQKYILIDKLPHSKTSTITDRLYGKYENLLITSQDGETNFYGSTEIINMLNEKFPGGWSGGQLDKGSGFWGGYADQEEIKKAVQEMIDKQKTADKGKDSVKEFWIKKYNEDKIGTVAKLSQAMQHGSWLEEWQRIHGNAPRIKPITKKVNGEKVKIGEADIAVPWSELHEFFRQGNEYGDVETVKFLKEKIESGDTSPLTKKELHDLSEKENVKWSDGKHSLNPFQGYLYDFTTWTSFTLEPAEGEDEYGHFHPISPYTRVIDNVEYSTEGFSEEEKKSIQAHYVANIEDYYREPDDDDHMKRFKQTQMAFNRFYTTRLLQKLLSKRPDSKYYDFVNFDITSVTTPEDIRKLDETIVEIMQTPEIKKDLKRIKGNKNFEKGLYNSLRREVTAEIKKDSDRIENAHKVYVALETGNLDEIFENPETARWAEEVYEQEMKAKDTKGLDD